MNYQKLYVDIVNIDSKIRLVTICDINGKVMFSDHRQGVKNLLSPEESKESLELAINSWKTRSKLAPKIGKGKYVLAEYENIKRITMPFGDNHILYVTTEPEADHSHMINRIRSLESGFHIEYLFTAGGEVTGGVSTSSVNKNLTIDERTGNMSDITSGGVSAASVGNGTVTSERIGNTSGPTFGGLSPESVGE